MPLHIGLLFDTSESMDKDLAFSRNAAIKFLKTFSKRRGFHRWSSSQTTCGRRGSLRPSSRAWSSGFAAAKPKGRTSLYDAVTVYLGSAFDLDGRKVLVIFTDGDDTSSSRRWDETLRLLRASDVTVYPMGFLSNRGSSRLLLQSKLMEIARLTGGRAAFPGSMKELDPMYAGDRSQKFRVSTCSATFPRNAVRDGKWRKVEIKLKRPPSERVAAADAGGVLRAGEVDEGGAFQVVGSLTPLRLPQFAHDFLYLVGPQFAVLHEAGGLSLRGRPEDPRVFEQLHVARLVDVAVRGARRDLERHLHAASRNRPAMHDLFVQRAAADNRRKAARRAKALLGVQNGSAVNLRSHGLWELQFDGQQQMACFRPIRGTSAVICTGHGNSCNG